jgi:hypothetical protein
METGPFFFAASCLFLVGVSGATRGQTDMRGLVTAGRAVRRERPGLKGERGHDRDHEKMLIMVVRS